MKAVNCGGLPCNAILFTACHGQSPSVENKKAKFNHLNNLAYNFVARASAKD